MFHIPVSCGTWNMVHLCINTRDLSLLGDTVKPRLLNCYLRGATLGCYGERNSLAQGLSPARILEQKVNSVTSQTETGEAGLHVRRHEVSATAGS